MVIPQGLVAFFGFRVCQAVVSDVIVFHESRICIIVVKLVQILE